MKNRKHSMQTHYLTSRTHTHTPHIYTRHAQASHTYTTFTTHFIHLHTTHTQTHTCTRERMNARKSRQITFINQSKTMILAPCKISQDLVRNSKKDRRHNTNTNLKSGTSRPETDGNDVKCKRKITDQSLFLSFALP